MIAIKRLSSADADFDSRLDALLAFESAQDESVDRAVAEILAGVKRRGDAAVIEYTNRFDRLGVNSMGELELARDVLHTALDGLPAAQREALELRYGEDLTIGEVGAALGMSRFAAARALSSALEALRADLGIQGEKDGEV